MVTNINLTSADVSEKKALTGKSTLILSALLLVAVVGLFTALYFMKSGYAARGTEVSAQISQEQSKLSGTEFSDMFDFQNRLNVMEKAIDDHAYWDGMLKRTSGYIIPEVKLRKFSGKKDSSGAVTAELSGMAANLDALSRQLLLLKDMPNLDSLEFKSAGESTEQGGVEFDASIKINKSAFQK